MMALRVGKDPFDYINEVKVEKSRQSMKRRLQEYRPNASSIDVLERVDEKHHLIVFSADWCSDCIAYIPGLAKSLIMAKNNMLQARVVDYDAYRDMAEEYDIRRACRRQCRRVMLYRSSSDFFGCAFAQVGCGFGGAISRSRYS